MNSRPLKVLLVEDDEDDYVIARHLLAQVEGAEFTLDWADSYSAGLEALEQQRHDIYLVDYWLGEGTGIEFLHAASARGSSPSIILLVSQSDKRIDMAAMKAGAADYLSKDQLTPTLLERSIRYALQHKRSQDELRLAESKYRSIFENAIDGIFQTTPEGRVLDANPAAARILGYDSPAEAKSLLTNVGQQLYVDPKGRETMRRSVEREGQIEEHEVQVYRKDGSIIWLAINIRVVRDAGGEVLFYEGSFQDVTERRQAHDWMQRANEELEARVVQRTIDLQDVNGRLQCELAERELIEQELNRAKEEAEQANRAKSEFLARMSHELRTPLNAILGFAQILQMRAKEARDQQAVTHIRQGGEHLLQLINEVLDIARIEAGGMEVSIEPLVAGVCVEEALALIRPLGAPRHIQFHFARESSSDREVLADGHRLRQVLINLLSNAIKYNREAGSVTISCREVPNGLLRISITDSGPGISAQSLKKLFCPFQRLGAETRNIEGSGLGLALSKRMIEALGGSIGVESAIEQGSTFWIELPLAQNSDPQGCEPLLEAGGAILHPGASVAPWALAHATPG